MNPTKEQIKKFWEWTGRDLDPEGWHDITIDLNNLFKYAVPKAIIKLADEDLSTELEACYKLFEMWLKKGFDALALFKAIMEVIDAK